MGGTFKKKTKCFLFFSSLFFTGFDGCSPPELHEVCAQYFSAFQEQVRFAEEQMQVQAESLIKKKPHYKDKRGGSRRLASLSENEVKRITIEDPELQEEWMRWSFDRLEETQDLIDYLDRHPRFLNVIPKVNRLADHLVGFHGYAEIGNFYRMKQSLDGAKEYRAQVQSAICKTKN